MTIPQRYALVAALGLVYAVATAWLVDAEGRSYRESLRETRAQGRRHVTRARPPERDPRSSASAGSSGGTRRAPSGRAGGIGPLPPTEPGKSAEPAVTVEPMPTGFVPRPTVALNTAIPRPITIPGAVPAPPAERSPGEIWADSLDLTKQITPEDEMRLGGELDRFVLRYNQQDPEGDIKRLWKAAEPLLKFRTRPQIDYTFKILESDDVNAFSLPGGFIYVSTGFFNLVGEDVEPENDYALQFALGHEIAHVDLKHTLTLIASGYEAAKKQGTATLYQCMAPVIAAYPNAMEFQADAWAYERMTTRIDPNRTRREGLMFLIQFEGFSKKHGFPNGRSVVAPTAGVSLVENHYRAHPPAWERLARLRAFAGSLVGADSKPKSQ